MKHARSLLTCLLLAPSAALHGEDKTPKKLSEAEARQFRAAAAYSRSAHGISVLVMRRGEIVFEDYAPGWQDKPHELASGTKSFAGVMAVCAVQDGLLKLDEKVSDTVTEWKTDPRKSQVTIRQLLSLCSGIEGGENGAPPMYRRAVVLAEATADPGTRFSYGPNPVPMLRRADAPQAGASQRIRRSLSQTPHPRSHRTQSRHLGQGPRGQSAHPLGRGPHRARMGEVWRVHPSGREMAGQGTDPGGAAPGVLRASSAKSNYGLTFWLMGQGIEGTEAGDGVPLPAKARRVLEERQQIGFHPPEDTVAAMGKGKQRCYIIPSLELVIIRLGDSVGREFSDNVFLSKLLGPSAGKTEEPAPG